MLVSSRRLMRMCDAVMRLIVVLVCVAVAACPLGAGAQGLSDIIPGSAGSQPAGHFNNSTQDVGEERVLTSAGVKSVASALELPFNTEQLDTLLEAKNYDQFFELFTRNQAANGLQPDQLKSLDEYVIKFNERKSGKAKTTLNILTSFYKDKGAVNIIEAAKLVGDIAELANKLQKKQMRTWLRKNKHPDDVLVALSLNEADDKLSQLPRLIRWIEYMDRFNSKKYINHTVSLYSIVTLYNLGELVKMLIALKETQQTTGIALRLENELFSYWFSVFDKPPAEAFTLLGLSQAEYNVFESYVFTVWMNYVEYFEKAKKVKLSVLAMLESIHEKELLRTMLKKASTSSSTKRLERELTQKMLTRWSRKNYTADDVYAKVNLHQPVQGKLYRSALLQASDVYIIRLLEQNRQKRRKTK